jgi:EF-hand domain-containing family member B
VPTIRTDVPFKVKRSVADFGNYGDEPEAVDLLFPQTNTDLGISEYDFQMMRTREQVKTLFEAIGYSYKLGKFNAIYNRAKELCQSADDKVSVRAMMQACQMLHNLD